MTEVPISEFSRIVSIARLGGEEETHEITATAEECLALSRRFDLQDLSGLTARVGLKRIKHGAQIRLVTGFDVDVVQNCVVSLEPVPAHITEDFIILFEPADSEAEQAPEESDGGEILIEDVENDAEPLFGEEIDIGECVAQYLSLSLPPYPRAPGIGGDLAHLEPLGDSDVTGDVTGDITGDITEKNPFAVLKALKKGS